MSAGSRVERDLETDKVLYSAACFDAPGCGTANGQGFPFAGLSISGSIVTVREEQAPSVVARGAVTEPGWHTDDAPSASARATPSASGSCACWWTAPKSMRSGRRATSHGRCRAARCPSAPWRSAPACRTVGGT